jgi:hypothetical protein
LEAISTNEDTILLNIKGASVKVLTGMLGDRERETLWRGGLFQVIGQLLFPVRLFHISFLTSKRTPEVHIQARVVRDVTVCLDTLYH